MVGDSFNNIDLDGLSSRSRQKSNTYEKDIEGASDDSPEKENIKGVIDELNKTTITHRNAREAYQLVINKNQMAETAIANLNNQQKRYQDSLRTTLRNPKVNEMMDTDRIVPLPVFEHFSQVHRSVDEMLIFRTLQLQLYKILGKKLFESLSAVKAMDIEREVTEGMREIQKEYMGLIKDLVNDKLTSMDNKLEILKEVNKREMETFQNSTYTKLIRDLDKINSNNVVSLRTLTAEFNSRLDKLYDKLESRQTTNLEKPKPIRIEEKHVSEIIDVDEELQKIKVDAQQQSEMLKEEREKVMKVDVETPTQIQEPKPMNGNGKTPDLSSLNGAKALKSIAGKDKEEVAKQEDTNLVPDKLVVNDKDEFDCPVPKCTRTFNNMEALKMHMEMAHEQQEEK